MQDEMLEEDSWRQRLRHIGRVELREAEGCLAQLAVFLL
jgi:hypothetical protein